MTAPWEYSPLPRSLAFVRRSPLHPTSSRMATPHASRFEEVVLPHLDEAYTLARYLVRDEHDAQDVVQDATLRALRHFDGFRDGDARAWLLPIVRNCCFSFHKKPRVDRSAVTLSDDLPIDAAESRATDALAIESSERDR